MFVRDRIYQQLATASLSVLTVAGCGIKTPWGDEPYEPFGAADMGETGGDRTYFIAEQTEYLAPCDNEPLNEVTADLQAKLEADQWHGQRRAEGYPSSFCMACPRSWPSDLYDQNVEPLGYGKDHLYGDNARVTVFAGHGNIGRHWWSKPDPDPEINTCLAHTYNYRLGMLGGGESSLFISASSCNGMVSSSIDDPQKCFRFAWVGSAFRQFLGFADSPGIPDTQLTTFYQSLSNDPYGTSGQVDAWILTMEVPYAGANNVPIVYTKVTMLEIQSGDDESLHFEMNMRSGRHMSSRPSTTPHIIIMSPGQYPYDLPQEAQQCMPVEFPC